MVPLKKRKRKASDTRVPWPAMNLVKLSPALQPFRNVLAKQVKLFLMDHKSPLPRGSLGRTGREHPRRR